MAWSIHGRLTPKPDHYLTALLTHSGPSRLAYIGCSNRLAVRETPDILGGVAIEEFGRLKSPERIALLGGATVARVIPAAAQRADRLPIVGLVFGGAPLAEIVGPDSVNLVALGFVHVCAISAESTAAQARTSRSSASKGNTMGTNSPMTAAADCAAQVLQERRQWRLWSRAVETLLPTSPSRTDRSSRPICTPQAISRLGSRCL